MLYRQLILLWMDTDLLLDAENTQSQGVLSSRLRAILDHHVKIGPVTGIEVFESAGNLAMEVQVPSNNQET